MAAPSTCAPGSVYRKSPTLNLIFEQIFSRIFVTNNKNIIEQLESINHVETNQITVMATRIILIYSANIYSIETQFIC